MPEMNSPEFATNKRTLWLTTMHNFIINTFGLYFSFNLGVPCVASVSVRVRRESWDESAITRLETLATQANLGSVFTYPFWFENGYFYG